jgi:hypothetical protein
MPINMFFIVKNIWEPSFTDNPRMWQYWRSMWQYYEVTISTETYITMSKEALAYFVIQFCSLQVNQLQHSIASQTCLRTVYDASIALWITSQASI